MRRIRYEEDLDSPCVEYGHIGDRLCSGCRANLNAKSYVRRCYRSGRAVGRKVRYREAIAEIPSEPATVWDRYRKKAPVSFTDLCKALAQVYGEHWTGRYRGMHLAKSRVVYEQRRFWVLGILPRERKDIYESFGLKNDENWLTKQWNRMNTMFSLFSSKVLA